MHTAADPEEIIIPGPAAKPGGIKATWHLQIVTGKDAGTLLEMQNQAIIDLLTWAAEHEKAAGPNSADRCEMRGNVSRGTFGLAA